MSKPHIKPHIDEPRIRFSIAGIIALCVSENKKEFDVGVVRTIASPGDIPGHDISVEIKKDGTPTPIVRYDRTNIPKQPYLRVIGQPPSVGIRFFAPGDFDRNLRDANHHFKWTLDVGNGELHSGVVTINPAAIRSVLHVSGVESAIFYTDNLSSKKLKIKDKHGPREFGFIAGTIEALIPLPRDGAEFFEGNGGAQFPLSYEKDVTYDITIKQTCSTIEDCSEVNAENVYKDLFRTGIPGKEIDIIGIDHKRAKKRLTPEIGCVGVNFSANGKLP
jgi:hypothetical protein